MSWARDDQNRAQCTYFYKLGAQGPKYSSCNFARRTLHMSAHVSTWNKVANGAIFLHACCCLDSTSFISVLGTEVAFTGFLVNPNPIHTHTGFPHNFWFSYSLTFQTIPGREIHSPARQEVLVRRATETGAGLIRAKNFRH